ncbi:MAG: hypothetical protein AAF296_09130 [Pseudomonadota bacterium]
MDERFWLEASVNMSTLIPTGGWKDITPEHVSEIRTQGCRTLQRLTKNPDELYADLERLKKFTDEAYAEHLKGHSAINFFERFIEAESILLERGAMSLKIKSEILNDLKTVKTQIVDQSYWNDQLVDQALLLEKIVCGWKSEPNESDRSAASRAWQAVKGATVLSVNGSAAFAIGTFEGGFSSLLGLGPGMSIKGGLALFNKSLKGRW